MVVIMKDTNQIDKDHNGYVLASELNKIFKTSYFKELEGKSITKLMRPYSSIQNKQLIDYKKFFKALNLKLKERFGLIIENES